MGVESLLCQTFLITRCLDQASLFSTLSSVLLNYFVFTALYLTPPSLNDLHFSLHHPPLSHFIHTHQLQQLVLNVTSTLSSQLTVVIVFLDTFTASSVRIGLVSSICRLLFASNILPQLPVISVAPLASGSFLYSPSGFASSITSTLICLPHSKICNSHLPVQVPHYPDLVTHTSPLACPLTPKLTLLFVSSNLLPLTPRLVLHDL